MTDTYLTLEGPCYAEFKDRASKFLAFAWPVSSEQDIQRHLETLRKEHFKANHHCYAWRLGREGQSFRANDDGEPSGTAGRPILAQIDAAGLTDVLIVVVRYFGGILLGASGLINAYRSAAAAALEAGTVREVILYDQFTIHTDYALLPDVVQAIHKVQAEIREEQYLDRARIVIALRRRDAAAKTLALRAALYKTTPAEAVTLDWPTGMEWE